MTGTAVSNEAGVATTRTVGDADMPTAGIVGSLREILSDLVRYRELLMELTRRDITIRYKQAVMGFGWAIFMPILIVLSGFLVRFAMSQMSGRPVGAEQLAGIALKGVAWSFFVGTVSFATTTLTSNSNLVSKVYFPREVLPLSALLAQTFDTTIGLTALVFVLPFLGVTLHPNLLWAPLLLALLFLITAAATLFLSCANLFFRDVKYIVQVLLTFGIFFTPVFYEPAMMGPIGSKLVLLNPIAPILEGLRMSVVENHNLITPLARTTAAGHSVIVWTPLGLLYSATVATLGLIASALIFHRSESAFAENV